MSFLKNWLQRMGLSMPPLPEADQTFDVQKQMDHIIQKENIKKIEPGRRIHQFECGFLVIRLDLDIAENYRFTVWQGADRHYSFTVFAKQGEHEPLQLALHDIKAFLSGDRKLADLPNNDRLKGFYYGHS